jgi:hypothetical protein
MLSPSLRHRLRTYPIARIGPLRLNQISTDADQFTENKSQARSRYLSWIRVRSLSGRVISW